MKLKAYIYETFETQKEFCAFHNVKNRTVSLLIKHGCIVIDDVVYMPKMKLKTKPAITESK